MKKTTFYIKNMVCDRCMTVLRNELEKAGAEVEKIILGQVVFRYDPNRIRPEKIETALNAHGFEILKDKDAQIVERIKIAVLDLMQKLENHRSVGKNSDFISKHVGYNYPHLSRLFSYREGISIERFVILHKIERTKELLEYGEFTLSEIADRLGYSSVQHLSSQFKQTTGITVSEYRKFMKGKRKPLDKLIGG